MTREAAPTGGEVPPPAGDEVPPPAGGEAPPPAGGEAPPPNEQDVLSIIGGGGEVDPAARKEARFLELYLSLDADVRRAIGHE